MIKTNLIIGYAYVCCDILNIGHIKHLISCKGLCDKLIVGVLTDSAVCERKPKPIISFGERLEIVKNLSCVDAVVKQETYSPLENILQLEPDILFESTSHREEDINKLKETFKGRVITMQYYGGQSSSFIKDKVVKEWKGGINVS